MQNCVAPGAARAQVQHRHMMHNLPRHWAYTVQRACRESAGASTTHWAYSYSPCPLVLVFFLQRHTQHPALALGPINGPNVMMGMMCDVPAVL